MLLCRVLLALGLTSTVLFSPSFLEGQDSKSQQPTNPSGAAPLLRRVVVKHHGFDDTTLNDAVMGEQEEYVKKHFEDRPRVETTYDQKKMDQMKRVLEDFWKERGITVGVRSTLTQVPSARRYAILEFEVRKQ